MQDELENSSFDVVYLGNYLVVIDIDPRWIKKETDRLKDWLDKREVTYKNLKTVYNPDKDKCSATVLLESP